MADGGTTRRDFLRTTTVAVAGAGLARAAVTGTAHAAEKPDPSRILNYNPKMGYRRLGKTELWISEVSLGGHGGSSWEDRVPVLDRAVELGVNYVDTNIGDEVAMYGEAMQKATRGKRDHWHIGFADWPVRLTSDWEQNITKDLLASEIDKRLTAYHTDRLDIWRPVGATWGDGQTVQATMLTISDRVLDMVVEVFEKAKRQGKVRFLGVSAHKPEVFRKVLNKYPQFSVIMFPYLFLTKELEGESLLALAKEKDVGVIGIKPFAAGTTFGLKPKAIDGRVDGRAHVLLKEMLKEKRVTAVLPGVNIPEQLEENVKASYARDVPEKPEEVKTALHQCRVNYRSHLTADYAWLHQWERV